MKIGCRKIGAGEPVCVVAELSANHNQHFDEAVRLIHAAKDAGADAVKLQTYTADTITLDCRNEYFQIKGTLWAGRNLHDLYKEAFTPWDWQPKLKKEADALGLPLFSTPFDRSAVDFLEQMNVPAYKVASLEIVDIPLIQYIARLGKPVLLSTGASALKEIEEAVAAIRAEGNDQIA
ncbi:MAG: N-acetylneuraminate synthase family protein, partial [Verrucomicrobia bacterium]|nr:N-acetylneuraminate synthase family protein [Verrucomicrobiota bacterium]